MRSTFRASASRPEASAVLFPHFRAVVYPDGVANGPVELQQPGVPFPELTLGTVDRVLRSGSREPLVCEMVGVDGPWVVKTQFYPGHMTTPDRFPLVAELAAAAISCAVGLPGPRMGLVRIPKKYPRARLQHLSRVDRETVAPVLSKNAGRLAVCGRYLDGAHDLVPETLSRGKRRAILTGPGAMILAFDAFCMQVDRTIGNPNLLIWNRRIVPIDNEAAFDLVRDGGSDAACADARLEKRILDGHPLFQVLRSAKLAPGFAEFEARVASMSDGTIRSVADSWPDELDCTKENKPPLREKMDTFLKVRRDKIKDIVACVQKALAVKL
jgi:hypothetical protein